MAVRGGSAAPEVKETDPPSIMHRDQQRGRVILSRPDAASASHMGAGRCLLQKPFAPAQIVTAISTLLNETKSQPG